MDPCTALIVSEDGPVAYELLRVLRAEGMPAGMISPEAVRAGWRPTDQLPDVLLVDASVCLATVRELVGRVATEAGRRPAVVSFTHSGFQDLEPHLEEGHDYLVPPFLPHLVRSRLRACQERRDLDLTVREVSASADRREYELHIGREIQRGFLPESLPEVQGWEIAAHFEPAREVSGDFYDAYDIVNGGFLAFAIADVCDKGIGAALFMALIRSLLRQAAVAYQLGPEADQPDAPVVGPGVVLRAVETTNSYLTTNHLHQAYFATLFFGVVDPRTGELTYINCGHNPPIVRRAGGELSRLPPTGPALGLIHDATFKLGTDLLDGGDLLFLYTDGIPEAKNTDGEFFGEERLHEVLGEPGSAEAVVDRFSRAVVAHSGAAEQFDDVTMLGLRRQPGRGPGRTGGEG